MNTETLKSGRRRRIYSAQFKAEMVAECLHGDVSLASLAVDHGMNPNVLHRWVAEHRRYGKHALGDDGALTGQAVDRAPANWIPLKGAPVADNREAGTVSLVAPACACAQTNETVELKVAARGLTLTVRWPVREHAALAHWTRELLT